MTTPNITADIFRYNDNNTIPLNQSSHWYESALAEVKQRLSQLPKLDSHSILQTPAVKSTAIRPNSAIVQSKHNTAVKATHSVKPSTSRKSLQPSSSVKQLKSTNNTDLNLATSKQLIEHTQYTTTINQLNNKIQSLELRLEGRQNALTALERQLNETKLKLHKQLQQNTTVTTKPKTITKIVKIKPIGDTTKQKSVEFKYKQQIDALKTQLRESHTKNARQHEINESLLQQLKSMKSEHNNEQIDMTLINNKITELSTVATQYQQKNIDLRQQYNDTVQQLKSATEQLQLAVERIQTLESQYTTQLNDTKQLKQKHKQNTDRLNHTIVQQKQCIEILYNKILAILYTTELNFTGITLHSLLPHELHSVIDNIDTVKPKSDTARSSTKHVTWSTPR